MNPGNILLQIFVLALAISIHESSHAYIAERCGDPTGRRQGRISLNPLNHIDLFGTVIFPALLIFMGAPVFGWAKPVPVNPSNLRNPRRDRALVSAAGPGANLLLAVIGIVLVVILAPFLTTASGEGLAKLLLYNTIINTLLAVFNLIPVPPLDGGGVLQYMLPRQWAHWMDRNQSVLTLLLLFLFLSGGVGLFLMPFVQMLLRLQFKLVSMFWGFGAAQQIFSVLRSI